MIFCQDYVKTLGTQSVVMEGWKLKAKVLFALFAFNIMSLQFKEVHGSDHG